MTRSIWLTLACSVTWMAPVAAWNDSGHMAIARWAWHELSDRERSFFSKLLRHHPHYTAYLIADRPERASEIEWAFCRGATWADWLRDPRGPTLTSEESQQVRARYHKAVWHYINLPIIAPKSARDYDAAAIQQRILLPPVDARGEPRHIIAAIEYNLKRVQSSDLAEDERAVALTWLLHLIGDLHQPLHSVALISTEWNFEPPSGDQGGNRIAVKVQPNDPRATRLHAYWDSIPLPGRLDFQTIDQTVRAWRESSSGSPPNKVLKLHDFLGWAEEGRELALAVVYRRGQDWLAFKPLPTGVVELEGMDAPILPISYRRRAEEVARHRQILAGIRLAAELRRIAESSPQPGR